MLLSGRRKNLGWFESLERRRLFVANVVVSEIESNDVTRTATAVDLRKVQLDIVSGTADSATDRDYFRVKVGANSRLQITVSNLSGDGVKVRVTDAFLNTLTTTTKRGSLYIDGGRSYFVKVQSKTAQAASYQIELKSFSTEVPQPRLEKLRKGVNLPQWFWNIRGDVASTMDHYIDDADIAMITKLGFGHVRLPVDMKFFFNDANHFSLNTTYLGELKSAILKLEAAGLGVIVCPFGDHQNWLTAGGDAQIAAKSYTWAFSKYLSGFDPNYTFIQTTNEPPGGGTLWQSIQEQLVQTIRSAAPKHTIITATPLYYGAGANIFGTTGALNELSTYRDTNIVYGLHFYEPFVFTHQGASWAIPGMQFINGLSFPANLDQTNALAASFASQYTGTPYEPIVDLVRYYGLDQWNRGKVESRLDLAGAWAARNRVPMILDEFGVYGASVDDASRYAYLTDVRAAA